MNSGHAWLSAGDGDQGSWQFRFRSHDADLCVSDLDALGQRAQVITISEVTA